MTPQQPLTFGVLLRRYREAAGLSQEDLAERAGLTASAIGALERGERRHPYPDTVRRLVRALDLDDSHRTVLISAIPSRASGKPAPVSRLSVRGNTRSSSSSATGRRATTFVGRQAELAALRTALADALAGEGGIVMLAGEAGIGKTHLAREFADEAGARGVGVLWGWCFEGDWQPPYGPWVEALTTHARSCTPEVLRDQLGVGAPAIAQLVPEIRAALPDVPAPTPLSPDEERFRLYDAIIRFLLTVSSEQPILLVLDDLHWADPDSLRLLRHAARFVWKARMLMLGAYRDPESSLKEEHPLVDTLSVLRRECDYERIVLRGFTREEVAEYLAQSAGQALPHRLVEVIEEETSGNPFYAREVFRHLTEEAKVLQRDGRWTTDISLRELGIPEGVRQVVGRRVMRLSERTGELLRFAAGFTGGFGFEVLQKLTGSPEKAVLDCIDEALRAGLIRTASRIPPRYEFAHAIVRHTLYEGLNPDRRARLHRRIALALEETHAEGGSDDAAELASQYRASAAVPGAGKGIVYAFKAAEQARAAYAHERAAAFLRMARDLAAESPPRERVEILRQLAIAEAEAVKLEDARQSAEDTLEMMRAAGVEPRARAEFLAVVARALKDGGADAALWEPLVERGLALVGGARDLLWARLALLRDHFEVVQSGPVGGRRWQGSDQEAIAVGRTEGDEEDYAHTLEALDWRTREETDAVLALARTWSRPVAIIRALDVAGRDLLYRHGATPEARIVYEELLAFSERFGSIPSQAEALAHIATSQMAMGELVLAQETFRRAKEVIARLGASHRMRDFFAISRAVALAYFLDGDWPSLAAESANYATSAAALRSSAGVAAAAIAALAASRAHNLQEARTLLEHLALVTEPEEPTAYAHAAIVSIAATAVWEIEAADFAATYRRLTERLIHASLCYEFFGPNELSIARMSSLLGDFGEALDYLERARRIVDSDGRTHISAIIAYDQARTRMRAGMLDQDRIVALLDAALEGFRAHGMLAWAARAEEQKQAVTNRRPPGPRRN